MQLMKSRQTTSSTTSEVEVVAVEDEEESFLNTEMLDLFLPQLMMRVSRMRNNMIAICEINKKSRKREKYGEKLT